MLNIMTQNNGKFKPFFSFETLISIVHALFLFLPFIDLSAEALSIDWLHSSAVVKVSSIETGVVEFVSLLGKAKID